MEFILKGITHSKTLRALDSIENLSFAFDLRPKSFNFTQTYKIKETLEGHRNIEMISILFSNEKDYVVNNIVLDIEKSFLSKEGTHNNLILEFCGQTPIADLEKYEKNYYWHYHKDEKIKNLANVKYLKRVIFHHQDLEELNDTGELHGFFQLFSEYMDHISIEVQLQWSSELIISMFDFFDISAVSFEISSEVEIGYQNPDSQLISNHIGHIDKLFKQIELGKNKKNKENNENLDIK